MTDQAPLTLESALSFMRIDPSAPPAQDDNQQQTDNASPADAAASDTNSQDDAQPNAADATEDPNTPPNDAGETNESDADPGDALPPIDAPSSWSTEEKAEWNSLSRKAQEVILRREQDATKALRTAQNSHGRKQQEARS
jgi:hypothetical protein